MSTSLRKTSTIAHFRELKTITWQKVSVIDFAKTNTETTPPLFVWSVKGQINYWHLNEIGCKAITPDEATANIQAAYGFCIWIKYWVLLSLYPKEKCIEPWNRCISIN